jgi:predicted GNAT family N-acyltransferase
MIKGKILTFGDDLTIPFELRKMVFQDELGIDKNADVDNKDDLAMHVIVEDDGKYIGTGRITYDDGICTIDKICVLKEYRNNKYGDFILRMLVNRALIANAQHIYVTCKKELYPFFKSVGFIIVSEEIDLYKLEMAEKQLKCQCSHK